MFIRGSFQVSKNLKLLETIRSAVMFAHLPLYGSTIFEPSAQGWNGSTLEKISLLKPSLHPQGHTFTLQTPLVGHSHSVPATDGKESTLTADRARQQKDLICLLFDGQGIEQQRKCKMEGRGQDGGGGQDGVPGSLGPGPDRFYYREGLSQHFSGLWLPLKKDGRITMRYLFTSTIWWIFFFF